MRIKLPVNSSTAITDGFINLTGIAPTQHIFNFTEEDEDGNIVLGKSFTATVKPTTDGPSVTSISLTEFDQSDGSDIKEGMVQSALATKTVRDTASDPNTLDIEYHGDESYADVFVSEVGTAVVAQGGVSVLPVRDSEVTSAKNLVVVGGSCVNSVAAGLLGGALCGADFEAKTGVGAGSFLVETFAQSNGGVATLVAGYNAQDTSNAAKYLTTQAVDTTVGKKYKGTTATSATMVVS